MAGSRPEGRRKSRIEQRGSTLRLVVYAGEDPVTGRRVYERETVKGTDDADWSRAEKKLRAKDSYAVGAHSCSAQPWSSLDFVDEAGGVGG
jgi:hypothetical protein